MYFLSLGVKGLTNVKTRYQNCPWSNSSFFAVTASSKTTALQKSVFPRCFPCSFGNKSSGSAERKKASTSPPQRRARKDKNRPPLQNVLTPLLPLTHNPNHQNYNKTDNTGVRIPEKQTNNYQSCGTLSHSDWPVSDADSAPTVASAHNFSLFCANECTGSDTSPWGGRQQSWDVQ